MPSTFAAIDKHTVTALRKGDASALEKVLRADYDALIHVAAKQLIDPTLAPQVVQDAILQVWDERAHIETPEELEKALHDAVQGNAVREQRRAVAQEGKPQTQIPAPAPKTADALWANVVAAMNAAPKADGAPKHQAADPNRHHATVHMGEIGKRSHSGPIVGGILLIAAAAGLLWWVNRKGEETAVNRSFSSPKASIASSAASQRSSVSLSDSTTVLLGAESKVIVPPGFGEVGTGRVVKLEGTATFVVKPGEANPFEVRAGTYALVATGTEFTVRAYTNEKDVTVRVKEGTVAIQGAAESRILAAGSAITIAKDGTMKEPSAAELLHALGWTAGRFVVANVPLKEVLPELKRWYPLDPSVQDKALLDRMVTMNVSLDSTKVAIAALEKSASVKFTYQGLKTVLKDAGAPAKK